MVGGGSVDSVVDWSVDSVGNNWGSVDSVVGKGGGVVEERSSMDSVVDGGMDGVDSMGDNSISTVKSVGGISNNSSVGAESLALSGGSVFSLEWLADRLVAHLAVSISIDWSVSSVVDWSNGTRHWSGQHWGVDSSVVTHEAVVEVGSGSSGQHGAQTDKSLH